jgi:hypothetical protein
MRARRAFVAGDAVMSQGRRGGHLLFVGDVDLERVATDPLGDRPSLARLMSSTATAAPRRASVSLIAAPIPEPPPVTAMVVPLNV